MKDHGRIKQVSTFSLIVACALLWLLLPQNKYRGIPGTAVFFHGKYRGRNFEYRPSLVCRLDSSHYIEHFACVDFTEFLFLPYLFNRTGLGLGLIVFGLGLTNMFGLGLDLGLGLTVSGLGLSLGLTLLWSR